MTVNEAAELLGVSPATIRQQIHNDSLAATKRGRDWDISPEEVRRYAAVSKGKPGRRPKQPTLGLVDR